MPYSKYSPKQKKLAALAGNKKKITGADLKKAGTSVEDRLKYLEKTQLSKLYRQCLTTYHFYAVAQNRAIDVAKTNESLIDVARQVSKFLN